MRLADSMPPRGFRIANGVNGAIVLLQVAGFGVFVYFAARFDVWWQVMPLAVGFGLFMNSVYSIIHEAEHGILFSNRRWNDATGVVMALLFPAPFHLIRQGHIGHHLRNRSDDEAFDLYFDGDHPVWKFMAFYGILTGFYYVVVVLANVVVLIVPYVMRPQVFSFDRPSVAFMKSLNLGRTRAIQLEGLGAILLHVGIIVVRSHSGVAVSV